MRSIDYNHVNTGFDQQVDTFVVVSANADRGTHAALLTRNPAYADLVNAYEQEHPDDAAEAAEVGER